jgi:hypothetical protein
MYRYARTDSENDPAGECGAKSAYEAGGKVVEKSEAMW